MKKGWIKRLKTKCPECGDSVNYTFYEAVELIKLTPADLVCHDCINQTKTIYKEKTV